jgi:hypothetical protein
MSSRGWIRNFFKCFGNGASDAIPTNQPHGEPKPLASRTGQVAICHQGLFAQTSPDDHDKPPSQSNEIFSDRSKALQFFASLPLLHPTETGRNSHGHRSHCNMDRALPLCFLLRSLSHRLMVLEDPTRGAISTYFLLRASVAGATRGGSPRHPVTSSPTTSSMH